MRGLLRAGAAGAALGLMLLLGAAAPASAHSDLEDGSPGPGDEVAAGVSSVHLLFGEDVVDDDRNQVRLATSDGEPVAVGAPSVVDDGRGVCAALDPLPAGTYELDWRTVSDDDHLVQSRYAFEVADGGEPADETACGNAELAAPQLPDEGGGVDLGTTTLVVGGGVLVLGAAGAFVWRVRADRRSETA